MSQSTQQALVHSDVREHLEKILAHRLFFRSARMVRFLRFAVERCLSGRADDLKEYVIGVEVFDRSGDYDPRVDPIVRVEARRLRAKLKAYYECDGAADPVIIEFLSGSYAPRISHRRVAPETAPPAAAETAAITVVVLPFADLSLKPGNEYFSDGLTEELIHVLTKVAGLRVVAWTTADRMRDRQQDLAAIREQLNASFVLTGSARIAGSSLRVRAQLIDTTSGVYQWSETFDRRIHDVFAIQEEIARAIVRTLRLQLVPAGPLSRSPVAINSYDHYLKGRYYWHRRTPEDLERSVEYFRAALDLDAQSSLAQTGLADAYTLLVEYGLTHPVEGMTRAREAATRAIALDPQSAEAHTSLALIRGLYDWQWQESELLFRRAIQLNPGYATAHHWLAVDCHAILGRLEEAVAGLEIARQLDPLSSIVREGQAFLKMMARDYEGAIASYRELIAADPDFYKGYTGLGRALALQGNYLDALRMLDQGRTMAGDIPNILAAMGQVYGLGGETDRAREMLGKLGALAQTAYVPSTAFAVVHLGLGEYERALDWLEKGLAVHDPPLTSLYAHPVYDPLRGHARFDALLCALNLR
ncbi:MAG TPA: tetratricopeptide repeat protein [Candidatus Acidoferrum sp.]|nr:tetratricopeptide repeat protein [Candidatus Acidoferrum sp.]